ncbi:hypothetical protein C3L33_22225, partial [Rhododendron williamsianum]
MGKKKNKNKNVTIEGEIQNDVEPLKNDDNNNDDDEGKGQKDGGVVKVVLKVDMHCEGCETKIKKHARSFKGVECVQRSNDGSNKLTVIGDVDPWKLREMLEKKTKKKVDLISPQPKKDKDKDAGDKKKDGENNPEFKEIPVTTAVMKLNLHCEGCIQKLCKAVAKTKGYHDMSIDEQKNQITVKGAIDMKALAESLKMKLRKPVEIVPPKKEKDGGGGEKKEKGEKGRGQGGEILQWPHLVQYGYPDPQYVNGYGSGYPGELFHAPQIFSDENPNACSVM